MAGRCQVWQLWQLTALIIMACMARQCQLCGTFGVWCPYFHFFWQIWSVSTSICHPGVPKCVQSRLSIQVTQCCGMRMKWVSLQIMCPWLIDCHCPSEHNKASQVQTADLPTHSHKGAVSHSYGIMSWTVIRPIHVDILIRLPKKNPQLSMDQDSATTFLEKLVHRNPSSP
jgi:5-methylcytosine-specific restriction endonuclease McrA